MDIYQKTLKLLEETHGELSVEPKVSLKNRDDLSMAYTPGIAEPCRQIVKNSANVYKYTIKSNTVAVITDGSAVLGLGNIGALAALPVMEGKCALFKHFGGVDAFPLCIKTQDTDEFIRTVKNISPVFGGINLEDIAAPRCFEIETRLKAELPIPVFHDDQHGTAIVVLAAMINSLKLVKKNLPDIKIVISGSGAAGIAVAKLLINYGAKNLILCDRFGAIYKNRSDLIQKPFKAEIAALTNPYKEQGMLRDVIKGADAFIGVSAPGLLTIAMIRTMASKPIVFAMANPDPEILPEHAKIAGAYIVATGRSDFPNQINNVLAFPGIFRGIFDGNIRHVTEEMKVAAGEALAKLVQEPTVEKIIPGIFDEGVSESVAKAIKNCISK